MKNPFIKEDNTGLWIGVIAGALAAGAAAYWFISENNKQIAAAKDVKEHATDYLKAKSAKLKKHKSDIHDLANLAQGHHEA